MSDQDCASAARTAQMLGLLASLGAGPAAAALAETFGIGGRLSADDRRFLTGPLVVHSSTTWPVEQGDLPDWLRRQALAERYEALLNPGRGWIIGPSEVVCVMYGATMAAPMRSQYAELYMWANAHAVSKHRGISLAEYHAMLRGPDDDSRMFRIIPDEEVLTPSGRLFHAYSHLAHDVKRAVIRQAGRPLRKTLPIGAAEPIAEPQQASHMVRLSEEARAVLSTLRACPGNLLQIPEQLPRPLYEQVDNALRLLGGRWSRTRGGHVFPDDPAPRLAEALERGAVFDAKKARAEYETPPELAEEMASHVRDGQVVLEPSAGPGALVRAALRAGAARIDAYDIDPGNVARLRALDPRVQAERADFLRRTPAPAYDRILMNPPFLRDTGIRHILHAWEFLLPGGVLVAVMPAGAWGDGTDAKRRFGDWLGRNRALVTKLPPGTFDGTAVETRLVSVQKGANE